MPDDPLFPGIHVEETPFALPAIDPGGASAVAFVGRACRGPVDTPTHVTSLADFTRLFGPTWADSTLPESMALFFANGGLDAWVLRLHAGTPSTVPTRDDPGPPLTAAQLVDPALSTAAPRRGLWALDAVDPLDLIVVPPPSRTSEWPAKVQVAIAAYARQRLAIFLADAPRALGATAATTSWIDRSGLRGHGANVAIHAPWLTPPPADTHAAAAPEAVPPSGAVAGVIVHLEAERGRWKSAAGPEATLTGVAALDAAASSVDDVQERVGLNPIKPQPDGRLAIWGDRTLDVGSEWSQLATRRGALWIEDRLSRGLRWVVFEPNGEALWARARGSAENFLLSLWRQGLPIAVPQPEQAFFVRCDATTMTPQDIDEGRLVMLVGLALTRRAEFVIVRIALPTRPAD